MTLHVVRIGGLITLLVLGTFYPFLPGKVGMPPTTPQARIGNTFGLINPVVSSYRINSQPNLML